MTNTLQYSCLENPLKEKTDRPQGHKELDMIKAAQCAQAQDFFFACGSSASVRADCKGGTAAWVAVTLVVPTGQGHRQPHLRSYGPIRAFFKPLVAGDQ